MSVHVRVRASVAAVALAVPLVGATLLAAPAGAVATTRYVATTGTDTGTCASKADACRTIYYAVSKAAAGDTVSIGAGNYDEGASLETDLTITGAGIGKTVVGGSDGSTFTVESGAVATFTSLTMSGNGDGAGVEVDEGSASVLHSSITGNEFGILQSTLDEAPRSVPHASSVNRSVTVTDSSVSDNEDEGVLATLGSVTIGGSQVSGNGTGADNENSVTGSGVVLLGDASATITTSTLAGNGSTGVYIDAPEIDDAVRRNAVSSHAAPAESVTVSRSTISGSGAVGAAIGPGATASITDSTITGSNSAGVYTLASTTTITDSTVTDTSAAKAQDDFLPSGGIVALPADTGAGGDEARALFAPRTLTSSERHGVRHLLQVTSKATRAQSLPPTVIDMVGSIDAENKVPDCSGTITDDGYNVSSDKANSCAFSAAKHSLSKTNPELGTLRDNGGPTETQLPAAGSPVLNEIPAGSAGCVSGAVDQRGVVRPQPVGGRCDIGAVEVAAVLPPIVIHPAALPDGTVGAGYSQTLTATGGKGHGYVWSLAPGSTLPAGLSLSSGGVISGTPSKAGTFSVTVSVDDPTTKTYRLLIHPLAVVSSSAAPTSTAPTSTVNSNSAAGQSTAAIANTGTDVSDLTGFGVLLLVAGAAVALGAGVGQRRRGRHQTH